MTSPSFADGAEIPAKFYGKFIGENISPALGWGSLSAGTVDLVLVMEDLNSPGTKPRIHVIAELSSAAGGLTEGALSAGATGVRLLSGHKGPVRYAGPRPLPGHGPHHYRFHLYALDTHVDLSAVPDVDHLPAALKDRVLASGTLTGTRES